MSDSEYHMVEFIPMNGGPVQLVRGRKKTEAELQAEAEAEALPQNEESASLLIRVVDGCNTAGGKALLLCDQDGKFLPNQVGATVKQDDGRTEITVTFLVDGEGVGFA